MKDISPQEKTIMQIVWDAGENYMTARDVYMALLSLDGKERYLSSLMTVMAKLVDKGYLDPIKKFRKSTYYVPLIPEKEYKSYVTKQFIDGIHNGNYASIVSALIDSKECTPNDIELMRNMLDKASEKK